VSTEELVRRIVTDVVIPDEARLWTAEDIGQYLQMSPRTVSEKLAARPGFPKPIRLGVKRWYMREILEWARRSRR
jgi:predicted DNA-binding transcriptional regulator AlpA